MWLLSCPSMMPILVLIYRLQFAEIYALESGLSLNRVESWCCPVCTVSCAARGMPSLSLSKSVVSSTVLFQCQRCDVCRFMYDEHLLLLIYWRWS